MIRQRREEVIAYGEYLKKVTALATKVKRGEGGPSRPLPAQTGREPSR